MSGYYDDRLSAERLKQCYDLAPPRVRQYLVAELEHVVQKVRPGDRVLELGCGYGRVIPALAQKARCVFGIDTSFASLVLGCKILHGLSNCTLVRMDAVQLAFRDRVFNLVACIQNGISAFNVNQHRLIQESLRVTRPGGTVLFSSYSDRFWEDRLEWFRLQSEAGLIGEIDWDRTGGGTIVCKDGFTATTVRPEEFLALAASFDAAVQVVEVDGSSTFCELVPRAGRDCKGIESMYD